MKARYKSLILVAIIVFISFLGIISITRASNDIVFSFENGYAYNGALPESTVLGNQRNITEPTGVYPATYSFTNEDIGETDPTDWNMSADEGTSIQVISGIGGHEKVLEIIDTTAGGNYAKGVQTFTAGVQTEGIVEFWVRLDTTTSYIIVNLLDFEDVQIIGMFIKNDGTMNYRNGAGGGSWVSIGSYSADVWYHIKWAFDCGTDLYSGWINGISEWTDIETASSVSVDKFTFYNYGEAQLQHLDAIGYSWDGLSYNTTYIDDIEIDLGTYKSGIIADTYIDDSNYYAIDSYESVFEMNLIKAEFIFNVSIDGYFDCYISTNINMDGFRLQDASNNVLYSADGTNVMDIRDLKVVESELWIKAYLIGDSFIMYIDYVELMYNYTANYYIGDNLISPVALSNNLETDKFEFIFDSSGDMNENWDDNVNSFTDIENDIFGRDCVNVYDSIDDDLDKSIRIAGAQLGYCGIERDFNTLYVNTSEVWWQFDLTKFGYPDSEIYTKIENDDGDTIAWFRLIGTYHLTLYKLADLSYYFNSEWTLLKSNIPVYHNYNMTFVLNWTDGDGFGVLGFDGENYAIPFENDQDSLGNLEIYGINDNNIVFGSLDFQIDWIRIIINGSSLSDELMPENVYILSGQDFSLLHQSFIEITFDITADNNVSIYLNGDVEIVPYIYNITAQRVIFINAYQDKSYSGLYFKIYNSTSFVIENIKVYGIQLVNQQDSSDNPFLEFEYANIDPNISYFYVSGNNLYYHLETDDSNLEYIQATFDIRDLSCESYAIRFTHKKGTTSLQSECRVVFTSDTYLSFISTKTPRSESVILPQDKVIQEIIFLVTDNDNQIVGESEGYFADLTFLYYPDIESSITTFNLLVVIVPLIILLLPTFMMYEKFGESAIIPMFLLMSIICLATALIPSWLFFVIIISSAVFLFTKKRITGGVI